MIFRIHGDFYRIESSNLITLSDTFHILPFICNIYHWLNSEKNPQRSQYTACYELFMPCIISKCFCLGTLRPQVQFCLCIKRRHTHAPKALVFTYPALPFRFLLYRSARQTLMFSSTCFLHNNNVNWRYKINLNSMSYVHITVLYSLFFKNGDLLVMFTCKNMKKIVRRFHVSCQKKLSDLQMQFLHDNLL